MSDILVFYVIFYKILFKNHQIKKNIEEIINLLPILYMGSIEEVKESFTHSIYGKYRRGKRIFYSLYIWEV
jgi:hypothetical protein